MQQAHGTEVCTFLMLMWVDVQEAHLKASGSTIPIVSPVIMKASHQPALIPQGLKMVLYSSEGPMARTDFLSCNNLDALTGELIDCSRALIL